MNGPKQFIDFFIFTKLFEYENRHSRVRFVTRNFTLWKLQTNLCLTSSKTDLPILGPQKHVIFFYFRMLCLAIVLWCKRKLFANFREKKSFLRSLGFFEPENFAECAPPAPLNLAIFLNWTLQNIPYRQQCARFRKSQKVLYHSTLAATFLREYICIKKKNIAKPFKPAWQCPLNSLSSYIQ